MAGAVPGGYYNATVAMRDWSENMSKFVKLDLIGIKNGIAE